MNPADSTDQIMVVLLAALLRKGVITEADLEPAGDAWALFKPYVDAERKRAQ